MTVLGVVPNRAPPLLRYVRTAPFARYPAIVELIVLLVFVVTLTALGVLTVP